MNKTRLVTFGRSHFYAPFAAFLPLIAGLATFVAWRADVGAGGVTASLAIGLLSWTLIEYLLHRFSFHASRERGLSAEVHGLHHDRPSDPDFVVSPVVFSVPLFALFTAIAAVLSTSATRGASWGIGAAAGYLVYEWIHYSAHHRRSRTRLMRFLKRYHMAHHFVDPRRGFGVSSPLWDWVFRTPLFRAGRVRRQIA